MPRKPGSSPRPPEAKAPNPPRKGPTWAPSSFPTARCHQSGKTHRRRPSSSRTFVLFGADEYCKPRAARFAGADPALLAKVAETMSLCLFEVTAPDLAAIAKRLPVGQLHADGRGLVPFVKTDVYQDLVFETVGSEGPTYAKQARQSCPGHGTMSPPDISSSPVRRSRPGGGKPSSSGVMAICSPCDFATIPSMGNLFDTEARSH